MARDIPITVEFFHVKGHQDDDKYAVLDRFATMNVRMDIVAKAHWATVYEDAERHPNASIPGEGWQLWIDHKKVTGSIRRIITDRVHLGPTDEYWEIKRKRYPRGSSPRIDWAATEKAMRGVSVTRRQWVTKHASGWTSVGKWMLRRKEWSHSACPRCSEEVEDAKHVWICPSQSAKDRWKKSMEELEIWMKKQKTHPGITVAVVAHLTAWREGKPSPPPGPHRFFGIPEAIENQNRIGWQALLEGCPAIGWREAQQSYFDWLSSRRTGLRWLSALIRKLWDVAWDLWDDRNGILHDKEQGQSAKERKERIRQEFEEGFDDLDRDTKLLFRGGLDKVLKYDSGQQKGWIERVTQARIRAVERQMEDAVEDMDIEAGEAT